MEHKSGSDQYNIIDEVNTFIFSMPVEYSLGHCVAEDMRMSAGIAIYFKSIFERVGELMDQRQNVGSVAFLRQNDRFIYYLITKELSHNKPTYDSITEAIKKLRDLIVEHDVKKLAIPRIGCGLDKLDWIRVKNIIKNVFQGVHCKIKICHFTQDLKQEKDLLRIHHPTILRINQNIKAIEKRKFEKLHIILYSMKTSLPAYWDQSFQLVNEKFCFKSQYYKDYEMNHELGQCLHYETEDAHIYVIITNVNSTEHFSYQNLEKGLIKIKCLIKNHQWHPTFVVYKIDMNNKIYERMINRKIMSLISSAFIKLTPCLITEINNDRISHLRI